jgi:DNA mismatch repair protein MutL
MPSIHQLSPSVVNKIAAGEVIERPASVVKELLENAVDAGSTRVDLSLEKGGSEVIRVSDNGCGIAADELPLAVASHATSKIRSADELFSVGTLGFRGEALASIGAVSRLSIRSRAEGAEAGAELEIVGGELQPVVPVGCPQGTTMEVRQLFFNTPVRHKFLRSTQTETGHATEAFTRLALGHPAVHFSLTSNGRPQHDLPPAAEVRQRIRALFGSDVTDSLIDVASDADGVRLSGYVANPTHSRANNRLQYLFLNGRAIRDRALQHALGEAYRGLLLTGRFPICFLYLDMPAEMVDVNVHPTKQEVRFQDGGRLYSQLLGMLRTKFLTTDLAARAKLPEAGGYEADDEATPDSQASQLVAWAKQQLGPAAGTMPTSERTNNDGGAPVQRPLEVHRIDGPRPFDVGHAPQPDQADSLGVSGPHEPTIHALQIHNRYLVAENDAGIEVIDQHALHERILYERLREKVLAEALEVQLLLVPEPVDLAAGEAAAVIEHAELLGRLGMKVEPFGGETVLLSSYPAMLKSSSPADALRAVVERLSVAGSQPEARDLLDDLLHTLACKAAVKYGDPLAPAEIEALLAQRHLVRDQHHCPHGRPTTLVFTRHDLDRQFKRI